MTKIGETYTAHNAFGEVFWGCYAQAAKGCQGTWVDWCGVKWEEVTIGKHFDVAQCSNPYEKRVERRRNPAASLN